MMAPHSRFDEVSTAAKDQGVDPPPAGLTDEQLDGWAKDHGVELPAEPAPEAGVPGGGARFDDVSKAAKDQGVDPPPAGLTDEQLDGWAKEHGVDTSPDAGPPGPRDHRHERAEDPPLEGEPTGDAPNGQANPAPEHPQKPSPDVPQQHRVPDVADDPAPPRGPNPDVIMQNRVPVVEDDPTPSNAPHPSPDVLRHSSLASAQDQDVPTEHSGVAGTQSQTDEPYSPREGALDFFEREPSNEPVDHGGQPDPAPQHYSGFLIDPFFPELNEGLAPADPSSLGQSSEPLLPEPVLPQYFRPAEPDPPQVIVEPSEHFAAESAVPLSLESEDVADVPADDDATQSADQPANDESPAQAPPLTDEVPDAYLSQLDLP